MRQPPRCVSKEIYAHAHGAEGNVLGRKIWPVRFWAGKPVIQKVVVFGQFQFEVRQLCLGKTFNFQPWERRKLDGFHEEVELVQVHWE